MKHNQHKKWKQIRRAERHRCQRPSQTSYSSRRKKKGGEKRKKRRRREKRESIGTNRRGAGTKQEWRKRSRTRQTIYRNSEDEDGDRTRTNLDKTPSGDASQKCEEQIFDTKESLRRIAPEISKGRELYAHDGAIQTWKAKSFREGVLISPRLRLTPVTSDR